jgi:hypothetical protein
MVTLDVRVTGSTPGETICWAAIQGKHTPRDARGARKGNLGIDGCNGPVSPRIVPPGNLHLNWTQGTDVCSLFGLSRLRVFRIHILCCRRVFSPLASGKTVRDRSKS